VRDSIIRTMGVTFRVYDDNKLIDREWPLDLIPRIIKEKEWIKVKEGLIQRITAINLFIHDVYHKQEFLNKKGGIFWNVIGPEGGWSSKEIDFFNKNNITFVKLSDTILRTSTASINASSILNQWRIDLKLRI